MEYQIKIGELKAFLDKEKIAYKLKGASSAEETSFFVASIFNLIPKGFYFLSANLDIAFEQSLIVTNAGVSLSNFKGSNIFIVTNEDPQLIYYKIIRSLFSYGGDRKIHKTAIISNEAIIGKNVEIGPYTIIGKANISDNVIIGSNCQIEDNTRICKGARIDSLSVIGAKGLAWVWDQRNKEKVVLPQLGGVIIGENTIIAANAVIVRGSLNEFSVIGKNTVIGPGVRLGHGTQIGNEVHLANDVVTAGNTIIKDYCFVGSGAIFKPGVKIAEHTIVGSGAVVLKNVIKPRTVVAGLPAKEIQRSENPSGMPKPLID